MPQIFNFPSPRVLQLMRRIEIEKDRGTLEQLFLELNALLNEDDRRVQPSKKTARSIASDQKRRQRGSA
jgi:hypothetical protein